MKIILIENLIIRIINHIYNESHCITNGNDEK
jgi:hypothetical protein